jgi:alkylated DNA repair protein (DNA oxidative demethylase)
MPRAATAETVREEPEGLVYQPELITPDEERELVELMEAIDFREFAMRGQTALRTVRHYGYDYGYESWELVPSDPLPDELEWVRDRCAELSELAPAELVQALVTRYPEGAGIGWHRDAPMFGAKVVGVSLLSPCRMRFQRKAGGVRRVWQLELEPRSAYVLAGKSRSAWQHSIPAAKRLRYSITFRTLKKR